MDITYISFEEGQNHLDWLTLIDALSAGHKFPHAEISDSFLYRDKDTLLSRSAWIDGLGLAVKSATIFPNNPALGKGLVNGAVSLFSDETGELEAVLDFHLVTKWKTAGDSLLAASRLARKDSSVIMILGAGTVGRSLREAYHSLFPNARFLLWNRSVQAAEKMAEDYSDMEVITDLRAGVKRADIVACATMTSDPILRGEWFQPGQHIDLIGAYRPDMREADDTALLRSRIFVDSLATTCDHIGELKIPLEAGIISKSHIEADFYAMDGFSRKTDDEITLFKNGGGAHLDLMTSRHILEQWRAAA